MLIRSLRDDETGILNDFLYEAIFVPEGMTPPPLDIINRPELRLYYEDFGSFAGDNCVVAECDGQVVGACWSRIMKDYGHIDDDTPSLAISLYGDYRGRGIGTKLLAAMLGLLRSQGYRRTSLAVQKANRAVGLYKKCGFAIIDSNDEEYIMACDLQ